MENKINELLEELKYNQNINFEKGLENRVNIDYVIERLEDILKDRGKMMNKLSDLQEEILADKLFKMSCDFSDDELSYAIEYLDSIKNERIEQDKEIILKELQEEFENKINEICLDTIEEYKYKYNIAWCFDKIPSVEYVMFEERENK